MHSKSHILYAYLAVQRTTNQFSQNENILKVERSLFMQKRRTSFSSNFVEREEKHELQNPK
jgi:hypothetical protein